MVRRSDGCFASIPALAHNDFSPLWINILCREFDPSRNIRRSLRGPSGVSNSAGAALRPQVPDSSSYLKPYVGRFSNANLGISSILSSWRISTRQCRDRSRSCGDPFDMCRNPAHCVAELDKLCILTQDYTNASRILRIKPYAPLNGRKSTWCLPVVRSMPCENTAAVGSACRALWKRRHPIGTWICCWALQLLQPLERDPGCRT